MIGLIISGAIGIGILVGIIYWARNSAENSNIPKASDQKPISKLSRRDLKRIS